MRCYKLALCQVGGRTRQLLTSQARGYARIRPQINALNYPSPSQRIETMATLSAVQRSAVTLSSAARIPASSVVLSTTAFHRALSAPTRRLVSFSRTRFPTNRPTPSYNLQRSYPGIKSHQQTRQNSNDAPDSIRQWGFEEVCTKSNDIITRQQH
jgi:hypothetical protein